MLHRNVTATLLALVTTVTVAGAQNAAPAPEMGPKVGEMAPDFTLPGASKDGTMKAPIQLSKFRGQTVVVAFFPKARTSGCTAQMTTYRDQWATLFNGGKGVQVIGISTDADTTQANWAKEANFPNIFAADTKGEVGKLYGAYNEKANMDIRYLYVVGPDGRITYTAKQFKPMVADAYTELGAEVKKASAKK
jgi:peroxiredoxin Q/BCP